MEGYTPSPEESERFAQRHELLSLSGDGIFATLQGEGVTSGAPAVFMRLQDCNLHCGMDGKGWQCDAWYTWDKRTPEYWTERTNGTVDEVQEAIEESWQASYADSLVAPRLVITGGEPLLQQAKLVSLIRKLEGWKIEIETNGTVVPDPRLIECQFNCSPKLENSGNRRSARYRPSALQAIAAMPNSWFKFVATDRQDQAEIADIVRENAIPAEKILVMAEGVDTETLSSRDGLTRAIAAELGGTAITRNHIFWYGDKRRT